MRTNFLGKKNFIGLYIFGLALFSTNFQTVSAETVKCSRTILHTVKTPYNFTFLNSYTSTWYGPLNRGPYTCEFWVPDTCGGGFAFTSPLETLSSEAAANCRQTNHVPGNTAVVICPDLENFSTYLSISNQQTSGRLCSTNFNPPIPRLRVVKKSTNGGTIGVTIASPTNLTNVSVKKKTLKPTGQKAVTSNDFVITGSLECEYDNIFSSEYIAENQVFTLKEIAISPFFCDSASSIVCQNNLKINGVKFELIDGLSGDAPGILTIAPDSSEFTYTCPI